LLQAGLPLFEAYSGPPGPRLLRDYFYTGYQRLFLLLPLPLKNHLIQPGRQLRYLSFQNHLSSF